MSAAVVIRTLRKVYPCMSIIRSNVSLDNIRTSKACACAQSDQGILLSAYRTVRFFRCI